MRSPQNLPLPPRIYPPFKHLSKTLPEFTPPKIYPSFKHLYKGALQNLPLPPRNIHLFKHLYSTRPESTPPSQKIPPFPKLYATLPEYTHPSQNIPSPLLNIYVQPSQVAYSCRKEVYSGRGGKFLECCT